MHALSVKFAIIFCCKILRGKIVMILMKKIDNSHDKKSRTRKARVDERREKKRAGSKKKVMNGFVSATHSPWLVSLAENFYSSMRRFVASL